MDHYYDIQKLRDALYGEILVACRKMDGKRVAIKSLLRTCVDSKSQLNGTQLPEDVQFEIKVMTALSKNKGHPNVMGLQNTFDSDNGTRLNLVLDYQPNGELFDVVVDRGRLPELDARRYFADCISGLRHIHRNGYCHRDLSLENCLVGENGEVVITDFGLAAKYTGAEKGRVGKGFYIAPEVHAVCENSTYDGGKADVWSLGVILFMMITGVPPTETPSTDDKRFRLIKAGRLAQMLRGWHMETLFSDSALDLVTRMLCVDPCQRISMSEICEHGFVKGLLVDKAPELPLLDRIGDSATNDQILENGGTTNGPPSVAPVIVKDCSVKMEQEPFAGFFIDALFDIQHQLANAA